MKNIKLMKSLTVFSAALVFQIFSAAGVQAQVAQCSALTGNFPNECFATPTALTFKIYELSLCTGAVSPTTTAIQKAALCETLFESTAGEDVDLTPGASFSMEDGFSIEEGTYTHGLLKLNTIFSMTTAVEMTTSYTSDDSSVTGASDSSGAFCFSNGATQNPNAQTGANGSQISCHASAFSAVPNSIRQKMFGEGDASDYVSNPQMNTEIAAPNTVGGLTASTDLYILDQYSALATGDVSRAGDAGRAATLNGSHDRKYILADQTLTSPVVIDAETKGLDIQFNVTNSASMGLSAGSSMITEAAFNGMLFIFSAN